MLCLILGCIAQSLSSCIDYGLGKNRSVAKQALLNVCKIKPNFALQVWQIATFSYKGEKDQISIRQTFLHFCLCIIYYIINLDYLRFGFYFNRQIFRLLIAATTGRHEKANDPQESKSFHFVILTSRLTVGVTRWWAGRDNAALPEPTSSHANCLKTRRLPPVGCTPC